MTTRLAVLASGTGSLFESMVQHEIPIKLLVTDRKCPALEIAKKTGIPQMMLPRSFNKDFDRARYTDDMLALLRAYRIDLVAMAGFMTIFSDQMFARNAYCFKILNTHPSLLPAFKGHHTVKDALEYGVKITGFTIHWATKKLDAGPILAQEAVPVFEDDTIESLHERIKEVERVRYVELLKKLMK